MADSFQGGVGHGGAGHEDIRARVAVQGTNLHALTGSNEVFRMPLARCTVSRVGRKIIVRDEQTSLVIWSEDDEFLDALAQAQHGTLRAEVRRIQQAARRLRLIKRSVYALIAVALLGAASVPVARWAVGGGVLAIGNRLGDASRESLGLPTGIATKVERELDVIGERLRPASSPSLQSFRVLLAGYTPAHSFAFPPGTVVVTAGLVCAAHRPDTVAAAIARELAHLENRHIHARLAEAVDWQTTLDLVHGDISRLHGRLLDYATFNHSPGFTVDQDAVADERATEILKSIGIDPVASLEDLAQAQAANLNPEVSKPKSRVVKPPEEKPKENAPEPFDWADVRDEACALIGR